MGSRYAPQTIERVDSIKRDHVFGWHPFVLNPNGTFFCGTLKCDRDGPVSRDGQVVVADESDENRSRHATLLYHSYVICCRAQRTRVATRSSRQVTDDRGFEYTTP
jgi:hypothetical protein